MKRKHTHGPQSVHNNCDDMITARLKPIDSNIKPRCEVNYTIPKAWLDELNEHENTVQQLREENEKLKEQFAQEERRCELLYEHINAHHAEEMGLNNDSDVEEDAPYEDVVEEVLSQYILQPAPRGYVMMNTTDLSGRWQNKTVAHFIRHICEIHPEFNIEATARKICKQLIRNDVAECSEYYIIRG